MTVITEQKRVSRCHRSKPSLELTSNRGSDNLQLALFSR
jgi:hypothetical protein